MTPDYTELERLAKAATPGPWDTVSTNRVRAIKGDLAVPIFESLAPIDWIKKKNITHKVLCAAYAAEVENANYIAAANPSVMLAIVAEHNALAARVTELEAALRPFAAIGDILFSYLPGEGVLYPTLDRGDPATGVRIDQYRAASKAMEGK